MEDDLTPPNLTSNQTTSTPLSNQSQTPNKPGKILKISLIFLGLIILIVLASKAYYLASNKINPENPKACPAVARICNNGQAAQLGPNCSQTCSEDTISPTSFTNNEATTTCGSCPQIAPPSADFCKGGTIIPGRINECGCQMPPTCRK